MKNQEISPLYRSISHRKTGPQSGSVIFVILIAISLFAALSFVMSKGFRASESSSSNEQSKLIASEILSYGRLVKDTVLALKIKGCTETQISFEHIETGTTYQNLNAPTDHSCDVFHPNGGGISWVQPSDKIKSAGSAFYEGKFYFYSGTAWQGVGTTCTSGSCTELMMGLNMSITSASKSVCESINNSLGISSSPQDTSWGGSAFIGTYVYNHTLGDEPEGTALIGKSEACVSGPATSYSYTKVLLAR